MSPQPDLQIDIQPISTSTHCPNKHAIQSWVIATLEHINVNMNHPLILTLRIVDEPEMQVLNKTYRHKDKPTNVLAFPSVIPKALQQQLNEYALGDIVLCAPVVEKEAQEQNKNLTAHWAHMMVHSTLHLLGYDHETQTQAQEMESHEKTILHQLGFPNPYLPHNEVKE